MEVGVYKGGTAWHLAKVAQEQGRALYLYDTFSGIPYRGSLDNHSVGDFADTSYEEVCSLIPEAVVIKGVFPKSIVSMGPVAFVHLDCDQEQSYVESVEALAPQMVRGGVMVFDDYNCLPGATKAVQELFGDRVLMDHRKAYVRF